MVSNRLWPFLAISYRDLFPVWLPGLMPLDRNARREAPGGTSSL
jgi:hypothetical protein